MTLLIVIVAIVLLVAVVAALVLNARKKEQRREQAGDIRADAERAASGTASQGDQVRATEAAAEQARTRADRLEAQAREERTAYDQARAQQEDTVREADRLDPDVDHRSKDYTPEEPVAPKPAAGTASTEPGVLPTDPHDPDFDADGSDRPTR